MNLLYWHCYINKLCKFLSFFCYTWTITHVSSKTANKVRTTRRKHFSLARPRSSKETWICPKLKLVQLNELMLTSKLWLSSSTLSSSSNSPKLDSFSSVSNPSGVKFSNYYEASHRHNQNNTKICQLYLQLPEHNPYQRSSTTNLLKCKLGQA